MSDWRAGKRESFVPNLEDSSGLGRKPEVGRWELERCRVLGRKGSPRVGRSGARSAPDKTAAAIRRKRSGFATVHTIRFRQSETAGG